MTRHSCLDKLNSSKETLLLPLYCVLIEDLLLSWPMFGGLVIRTVLTVFIPLRLFCFDWTFTGPT